MRWDAPKCGSYRTIRRLLFIPRKIDYEWRWLELVRIKQRYDGYRSKWVDSRWIEGEVLK